MEKRLITNYVQPNLIKVEVVNKRKRPVKMFMSPVEVIHTLPEHI